MAKPKKVPSDYHGILVLDKPPGMTSHDVVDIVRRVVGTRQVGHTGTLDPVATGVLVIMLGEATKLSEYLVTDRKSYEGSLRLGATSTTYDPEGVLTETAGATIPDLQALSAAAASFIGPLSQIPPPYSARKVAGKRLYEYAREGEVVEAPPRDVQIERFDINSFSGNEATFTIDCTSGTYVRSLVHDMGLKLGCGAYMLTLRRTRVGEFTLDDAHTLDQLKETADNRAFAPWIIPGSDALPEWPLLYLLPGSEGWLRRGQTIPMPLLELAPESPRPKVGNLVFMTRLNGSDVAVARCEAIPKSPPPAALARHGGPWFQPVKFLSPPNG